ncbi:CsbD family protein [Rhodococcus sp. ABRD24]|uniref:CsbD family protein n=1 Tax=Rhodococcus sp. ABRD24 TaxID=2507582 RepID=UPI0010391D67|nr:CsbD family protein [Rhodococcus sp. ABRD24]QBJ96840.1 CsbD family protein [Rhodococcus sp. ABRD24]
MGIADKAQNKAQDLGGKAKETAGKATGDDELKNEGKGDQVESAVKDAGEKVKDAASTIKDKLTGK